MIEILGVLSQKLEPERVSGKPYQPPLFRYRKEMNDG
jgi:hypothetical protein